MLSFTTQLAGRSFRELPLTPDEALRMAEVGFRFAEFNPEAGRFRLSQPYELVIIPDRNSLTIRQEPPLRPRSIA
ncbi:hypothetical protein SAMN02983003_1407 [Devosia enhydra]|uniref:Uncharacterized protein n=1 Tax=Devosia enhydra TaxID=665118 RepID=A0A1K2HWH9_9HYPH|nr:hypothetical protein [Devosia enhydra]SFZ83013.1 hypothetical protein SAMN02983003_1407 [Devosia enhydra]